MSWKTILVFYSNTLILYELLSKVNNLKNNVQNDRFRA